MTRRPTVSVILATHNRRAVALATVGQVLRSAASAGEIDILVVDNASTDGTADAIEAAFPAVRLIRSARNLGSCAKALGVPMACGRFILFLDDDSYPRPGSLHRMIEHLERDPQLGAAGFRVHLPDGSQESSALPDVFVGCGVGFRAEALHAAGGLDADLFMQAEEYHLAFRLVNAGWKVRLFADLHVEHLKTPQARRSARTVYLDTRNNLLLGARYLPAPYHRIYAHDWRQRYRWIAADARSAFAYSRGNLAGTFRGHLDRARRSHTRLTPSAFETLLRLDEVAARMHDLRATGVRRIILADLGKNIYAYHRGALEAGLLVDAVADDRFAAPKRFYRGIPIKTTSDSLESAPDVIVIANMSPVHAAQTRERLASRASSPIHDWFSHPASGRPIPSRRGATITSVASAPL